MYVVLSSKQITGKLSQDFENLRKLFFLILYLFVYSNTAGVDILKQTLEFWHDGRERETIELKDMEKLVTTSAVNTKSSMLYMYQNN